MCIIFTRTTEIYVSFCSIFVVCRLCPMFPGETDFIIALRWKDFNSDQRSSLFRGVYPPSFVTSCAIPIVNRRFGEIVLHFSANISTYFRWMCASLLDGYQVKVVQPFCHSCRPSPLALCSVDKAAQIDMGLVNSWVWLGPASGGSGRMGVTIY